VTTQYRLERKFVAPIHTVPQLERLIRTHPGLFSEAYPPRGVHSVYLDTLGLRHYQASVAGVQHRRKIRVRWYGAADALAESDCALEIKVKAGWAGTKQVIPLGRLNGGAVTRASLKDALGERAPMALETLLPVLLVSYRRRYFRSASGLFRLTLDTDVSYVRVGGDTLQRTVRRDRTAILELKYAVDTPGAERITQSFPFRLARNSKYTEGIEQTRP
jgi:SPX domain protein involved in polyphosphate accumulation